VCSNALITVSMCAKVAVISAVAIGRVSPCSVACDKHTKALVTVVQIPTLTVATMTATNLTCAGAAST
jgi:hypothetical protein